SSDLGPTCAPCATSSPACGSSYAASATTSVATWLGEPSPAGGTWPPTTPTGRSCVSASTSCCRTCCPRSRRATPPPTPPRYSITNSHPASSFSTPPTELCAVSVPSSPRAVSPCPRSTSTRNRRSWRNGSAPRTARPWKDCFHSTPSPHSGRPDGHTTRLPRLGRSEHRGPGTFLVQHEVDDDGRGDHKSVQRLRQRRVPAMHRVGVGGAEEFAEIRD